MSETFFPINDLLRRKGQTSLVIFCSALCVASTISLLLFAEKIGFSFSLLFDKKLTAGFSVIFSNFIILLEILVFVVGIVIMSFMIFIMMAQKVKDIGLIKAAGCPNDFIFGYFMFELLIVTFLSCFLGFFLGVTIDFILSNLLISFGFQILTKSINWILILLDICALLCTFDNFWS